MVQATAIWLGFDADVIRVAKETIISQFPEIEYYPDTELSRKVGSSIRAMVNMLFGPQVHIPTNWPDYFWNRGIAIDPCDFADDL